MTKPFDQMTEPELRGFFNGVAKALSEVMPQGELFCLITFATDHIGQYVSNAERSGIIKSLREFADRLEQREDVTR